MGVKDLIDNRGLKRTAQKKPQDILESYILSADMTLNVHVKKQTPPSSDQTLASPQGFYYLQHAVQ